MVLSLKEIYILRVLSVYASNGFQVELTGFQIIHSVNHLAFGHFTLSFAEVYPLLRTLQNSQLIHSFFLEGADSRRYYKLTEFGRLTLSEVENNLCK